MFKNIFFIVINAVFVLGVNAQNWEPIGSGTNHFVSQLFVDSTTNNLFIGGRFRFAGGDTMNGVTQWDGNQFSPLGTGLDDCQGIQCDKPGKMINYKGELYISSAHNTISGIPANGIARWDGTNWNSLGSGLQKIDSTYGLAFRIIKYQSELYVFGIFDLAGGIPVNGMAKWDGNQWHSIPEPDPLPVFWLPHEAIVFEGDLYVGGNFYFNLGSNEIHEDIIKFNGEEWEYTGLNYNGFSSEIVSFEVYKGELYAGGLIAKDDGNPGNGILKLEGDNFVDVGGSFPEYNDQISDLMVFNDKLYAFGVFESVGTDKIPTSSIAAWDGTTWYGVNDVFDNRISHAAIYNGELVIGGAFWTISGDSISYLAKWNCQQPYDSCGTGQATAIQPTAIATPQVRLFPNPVRSSFSLSVDPAFSQSIDQLVLYNALGEMVKSWEVTDSNQAFGVEGLPRGVYFYTINGKGRMVGSGKVVVW
jgi:hypothetical protein